MTELVTGRDHTLTAVAEAPCEWTFTHELFEDIDKSTGLLMGRKTNWKSSVKYGVNIV